MSQPHKQQIDSPAISGFLQAGTWKRVPHARVGKWVAGMLEDERRYSNLVEPSVPTLDPDAQPYRIMVMWRLVRATAAVKGQCAEDESLELATEEAPDPWVTPTKPRPNPLAQHALRRQTATRLHVLLNQGEGLPLLPPRDLDECARWCDAMAIVAGSLKIETTIVGLQGLPGLLDPRTAVGCTITSDQVIAFEEVPFLGRATH